MPFKVDNLTLVVIISLVVLAVPYQLNFELFILIITFILSICFFFKSAFLLNKYENYYANNLSWLSGV